MNVHINANCISCGLCVSTCPDVFHITEGGTAGVYSREVSPELEDVVQLKASFCLGNCLNGIATMVNEKNVNKSSSFFFMGGPPFLQ